MEELVRGALDFEDNSVVLQMDWLHQSFHLNRAAVSSCKSGTTNFSPSPPFLSIALQWCSFAIERAKFNSSILLSFAAMAISDWLTLSSNPCITSWAAFSIFTWPASSSASFCRLSAMLFAFFFSSISVNLSTDKDVLIGCKRISQCQQTKIASFSCQQWFVHSSTIFIYFILTSAQFPSATFLQCHSPFSLQELLCRLNITYWKDERGFSKVEDIVTLPSVYVVTQSSNSILFVITFLHLPFATYMQCLSPLPVSLQAQLWKLKMVKTRVEEARRRRLR